MYAAVDLFEAFLLLRSDLEKRGYLLLCAGSRKDSFPSRMSRSMSGGRKVYLHQLGQPATELVDLLDPSSLEYIGSIEEQAKNHRLWKKSLMDKANQVIPSKEEIEIARHYPSGTVSRIAGKFSDDEEVPPEAVIGVWSVNEGGEIVGPFMSNPNYDRDRFPQSWRQ